MGGELLAAAHPAHARRRVGVAGGDHEVLPPLASRIEGRQRLGGLLQALEIGVGDRHQGGAAHALLGGHVLEEHRPLGGGRRRGVAERTFAGRRAGHDGLDLTDFHPALDVQAHAEQGAAAALLHGDEGAGLGGVGVDEGQLVVADRLHRAPQPVAELQRLAVLGGLIVPG